MHEHNMYINMITKSIQSGASQYTYICIGDDHIYTYVHTCDMLALIVLCTDMCIFAHYVRIYTLYMLHTYIIRMIYALSSLLYVRIQ